MQALPSDDDEAASVRMFPVVAEMRWMLAPVEAHTYAVPLLVMLICPKGSPRLNADIVIDGNTICRELRRAR